MTQFRFSNRVAIVVLAFATLRATFLHAQPTINQFPLGADIQPLEIAAGPDGNLWYAVKGNGVTPGSSKVGRITTAGVITEFVLPDTSLPVGMTVGPDGAMWFTESGPPAAIGRIDIPTFPAVGSVIHFSAGLTSGSTPFGICAGPDHNLWFAERNNSALGRITTAGVVTEFPIPGGASPLGVAAGPDGNIWFTDRGGLSAIGAMRIDGTVVKKIKPPTDNGNPDGITVGPDQRIWFVELAGKVGVVATTGQVTADITEYTTPTGSPYRIISGPDGNLWFTENNGGPGGKIAKITPAGVITEYTAPGLAGPYDITAAPGNEIWFTEPDNSPAKIGQLTIDCGVGGCSNAALFFPVAPCRRFDSRQPSYAPAFAAGEQRSITLAGGPCTIPAGAKAVSINLTVTAPSAKGDLKTFATGVAVPPATAINFGAGQTRANNGLVALAADGTGRIDIKNDAPGTVHVIVDVNGYFQ